MSDSPWASVVPLAWLENARKEIDTQREEIERLRAEIAAHACECEVLNGYCDHYRKLAEIRLAIVGRTRVLTDEDVAAVAEAVVKAFSTSENLPDGWDTDDVKEESDG